MKDSKNNSMDNAQDIISHIRKVKKNNKAELNVCSIACEHFIEPSENCSRTMPPSAVKKNAVCLFEKGQRYHKAQQAVNRKATTRDLSARLEHHIDPRHDPRIYWAKEVTLDYGTSEQKRVDYMVFEPVTNSVSGIEKGDFYCYEVKSSVEDFHSKNGHNMIGDFNYYVMPEDVYEQVKGEIHRNIGIYVPDKLGDIKCIKKAKRQSREYPVPLMLLMMFRSANRDRMKGE